MYSIALHFFHGDAAAAADVTQHVFLKLLGNIGQFRGESGFSTWLYRFVVNACVDRTRRAGASARHVDPAVLDEIEPGPFPTHDEVGRYRNALRYADEALGALMTGVRESLTPRVAMYNNPG